MMIEIQVSGRVFSDGLDPLATDFPREIGLAAPAFRKVGKGTQYTYTVSREIAARISWHLMSVGMSYADSDDAATARGGKAMMKASEKIAAQLA